MIKRFFVATVFFVITAMLIPFSVFLFSNLQKNEEESSRIKTNQISVYFKDEGKTRSMDIEEYLCGVVAAEMPAEFETEALKAQAVAARSYAFYRQENPSPEHPDAAVCTDFAHCKAYKTQEEQASLWKEKREEYSKKISDAVYDTAGEIITYNGDVAMAVFHSQAGSGRTENSKDVWGGDVPYLISVESHGEESAPNFYSTQSVSFGEFREKLASVKPNIKIETFADIAAPTLSEGGSVKSIIIGGEEFSGKEIRSIFALRSSCFKIIADNEKVTFEVTGYGHGVGMSQYGANTMAKEGYSYIDILTHYYTGTKISGV
ncbi:MAG: stage II sporulation protein D [Clostridia bacterium]|nr:stage II sporulation protein D [Clostridia bacterium]